MSREHRGRRRPRRHGHGRPCRHRHGRRRHRRGLRRVLFGAFVFAILATAGVNFVAWRLFGDGA
ncbi:MAG: hypothetical protein AAGH15_24140, partial [Myxococcota bacterium]